MRTIATALLWVVLIPSMLGQNITGITPNEGNAGSTLNVTITGTGTHFMQASGTTVGFFFSGATSSVTFTNSNNPVNNQTLLSNVSIPAGVADGWYDYAVFNDMDGFMLKTAGFRVRGPRIDTIMPNNAKAGQILQVTITGTNTHFAQASSTLVRFHFSGASATATYPLFTNVLNNTTLLANLEVPVSTPTGWYDYSVTNEVDGYLLKPAAFYVLNDIGVQDVFKRQGIELFPNPFTEKITLKLEESGNSPWKLRIFDVTGTLVEHRTFFNASSCNDIPVGRLKSGVYYFVITSSDGSTYMQKVIRH